MATLFISAFFMLTTELSKDIFQLMMHMLVPQQQVLLIFRRESVFRNIDSAFVNHNFAGRHSIW